MKNEKELSHFEIVRSLAGTSASIFFESSSTRMACLQLSDGKLSALYLPAERMDRDMSHDLSHAILTSIANVPVPDWTVSLGKTCLMPLATANRV